MEMVEAEKACASSAMLEDGSSSMEMVTTAEKASTSRAQ